MVYTKEHLHYRQLMESSKLLFDDSALFLSPKTKSKSKKRHKSKLSVENADQLLQINEVDDSLQMDEEYSLQLECNKLLREIRAEIKYAESCAEFGDYLSQLISWSCWLPTQKGTRHDDYLDNVFREEEGETYSLSQR